MLAGEDKPSFETPGVVCNSDGWGPISIPEQFKDIPYQPFSKSDNLGQVTDWTGTLLQERRYKYNTQFGTGQLFSYYHEEDESSFQLVDTSKPQKSLYQRSRARYQNRRNQRPTQRVQDPKTGRMTIVPRYNNMRRNNWNNRGHDAKSQVKLKSSVEVRKEWELEVEIEFSQISKLHLQYPEDKIQNLVECGTLEYYDKRYDRVTTKAERPLMMTNRPFHYVSTTDDPIIRELAKEGNVFATDSILATIMTCPRSYYSWDIIIQRVGSRLFLDKRDDSDFDLLTVNETANELPVPAEGGHNSLSKLALEATYINQNFSQQVLRREQKSFERANPFIDDDVEQSSVAYRYRKIPLLGPGEPLTLICRTELDAVTTAGAGEELLMNVKALNEWDLKGGVSEWRQKLDTQRGDILTTEMKNNKCKLAKWTVSSILAGADLLKFGYVTRQMPRSSGETMGHSILGTQQFIPKQFAAQISLDMNNAWGILRVIVDRCMSLPDGKYVLFKEPSKGILRIYRVPQGTFEEEDDDDSEDDK
jgi:translation initiation factor 3 subunit D